MSDRSDELTESRERESGDSRSTEDLLEETERLLEETEAGSGTGAETELGGASGVDDSSTAGLGSTPEVGSEPQPDPELDPGPSAAETDADSDSDPDDSSTLSRFVPSLPRPGLVSRGDLFSPKAFLALVLLIGAGLLAGGTVIPVAGRLIGMFAVAFLVGLLASKRRYLEMAAAGVLSSGLVTLVTDPLLAVAGNTQILLAVGATAGLATTVVGYYFGRDLRAGLSRDVD
ncbi:hypothetical protein [Natronobacterium haloterrestre]|nr:hypothetical protein [Halobiforma haloterrestris]